MAKVKRPTELDAQPDEIVEVGSESEVQARALAATHDPFGLNWMDEAIFVCKIEYTEELHVIGDVMLKSVSSATPEKRRKWQRSKN